MDRAGLPKLPEGLLLRLRFIHLHIAEEIETWAGEIREELERDPSSISKIELENRIRPLIPGQLEQIALLEASCYADVSVDEAEPYEVISLLEVRLQEQADANWRLFCQRLASEFLEESQIDLAEIGEAVSDSVRRNLNVILAPFRAFALFIEKERISLQVFSSDGVASNQVVGPDLKWLCARHDEACYRSRFFPDLGSSESIFAETEEWMGISIDAPTRVPVARKQLDATNPKSNHGFGSGAASPQLRLAEQTVDEPCKSPGESYGDPTPSGAQRAYGMAEKKLERHAISDYFKLKCKVALPFNATNELIAIVAHYSVKTFQTWLAGDDYVPRPRTKGLKDKGPKVEKPKSSGSNAKSSPVCNEGFIRVLVKESPEKFAATLDRLGKRPANRKADS